MSQYSAPWTYGFGRYRPKMSGHVGQEHSPTSDFRIVMVNKRFFGSSVVGLIMKGLYELAGEGTIILETKDLQKYLTDNSKNYITGAEIGKGISSAEEKGLIIVTKRQIMSNPEREFVSINLPVVSLESVMWILKSLENDQMTPTERSVQSRFKESFGIKISALEWEKVMKAIRSPKLILKAPSDPRYEFDVTTINDPVSGSEIFAIYPKGRRWVSLDISLQANDIDQGLFKDFLAFMQTYLCGGRGYGERAIPGGRYGCAQFVKACGSEKLRKCSLGQLSQFIQFAINEDVLRYKKTLLVWNRNPTKLRNNEISLNDSEEAKQKKAKVRNRLNAVKRTIVDVLTENPLGLSLAQLPLHLKYRLAFPLDLNELGFVKLKELLGTMSDRVKIELRGHNHPFAVLVSSPESSKKESKEVFNEKPTYQPVKASPFITPEHSLGFTQVPVGYQKQDQYPLVHAEQPPFMDFNKHLGLVRGWVYRVLQDFPAGIDSSKLAMTLYSRLGVSLDLSLFGCSSLLEFLQKYVATHIPLDFLALNPYDSSHFIVRRKDIYVSYGVANYYGPQYAAESYVQSPYGYYGEKEGYGEQDYATFPSVSGNEPYSKESVTVCITVGFLLSESHSCC
eukprot:TRINITY_DN4670_c0_g1_i1.p1 TRINITY_DN4670_c0_g1~~TRINITY_DN4670_c0_g1_i1.p1  ORF type:complete len:622 (+),score=168.67 TRINITY_DN4670_c0_g1_i1:514-2379(+)